MRIDSLYRLFLPENILEGMELYLGKGMKVYSEKEKEDRFWLCGSWSGGKGAAPVPDCVALFDMQRGILLKTECRCREFLKNRYECSHVAGLAGAFVERTEGMEALTDSEFAKQFREYTGVENPFLDGVLRKTDPVLALALTNGRSKAPRFLAEQPRMALLSMECVLSAEHGCLLVECRLGMKRKYLVKSMKDLIACYKNADSYVLGKDTVRLVPAAFSPETGKMMEFFLELYEMKAGATPYTSLFEGGRGQEDRYLVLDGRDMDVFMELLCDIPFFVGGAKKQFDAYEEKKPELFLKKKEYGAVISTSPFSELAAGCRYLYCYDAERLFKFSVIRNEKIKNLLLSLGGGEECFVSEKDVYETAQVLLPQVQEFCEVKVTGLEPERYCICQPELLLYLDFVPNNMVTCKPYVRYAEQGKKYLLYDLETDRQARNRVAEAGLSDRLAPFFHAYDETEKMLCWQDGEEALYDFLQKAIPMLKELGEVYISDAMQKLKPRPASIASVGISVEQGSLLVSLHADALSSFELAEILSAYSVKKRYHRLKNGAFVSFEGQKNEEEWAMLSELFQNHNLKDPEQMKLPLFRAMYLEEMMKKRNADVDCRGKDYVRLLRKVECAGQGEYEIPAAMSGILREYQKEGFYWLCTLKEYGFGGILADDMGLGKTVQVLAFLLHEKEQGKTGDAMRTLIVTPASLVYNWKKEIERFAPQLSVVTVTGSKAARQLILQTYREKDADLWITSYDLLRRDISLYQDIVFANQVIDEAQYIKNHNTLVSSAARLVTAGFCVALTGTPIENKLSELWSIFDFLMPGFLYGYTRFRALFEEPVVVQKDERVIQRLRGLVQPFLLRRLKRDVLSELPEKLEETVFVSLDGKQKKLYDAHVERLQMFLDRTSPEEFDRNKIEVLAELTKLRLLCCGPGMMFEDYDGENAKLESCMELVSQAVSGGHKVLIFSQFTKMLDIIGKRLEKEEISFHRIDGSVKKEQRIELVERFQTDDVPVFCISLKAGGTGLNLTAADIVVHYDPWWNAAAQNQATDRAHRIGQKSVVTVYRLIAEETIEKQILQLQESKSDLVEQVLAGEAFAGIRFDKEEILKLLS